MAVKREWTDSEKQSLLEHVTECKKKNITIKDAAKLFSNKSPYITPGQGRVYYYKLINETENFRKRYLQRVWTNEENNILFDYVAEFKNKRKIEIFDMLSVKLYRHAKAIASHYYSLKNNSYRKNVKYYSQIINNTSSSNFGTLFFKISKIHEIYEKALEIESILHKEESIIELKVQLSEVCSRINSIERKIVSF